MCLQSNLYPISPATDGGKWYNQTLEAAKSRIESTTQSSTVTAGSALPCQWTDFKAADNNPPEMFNYGHIYHHIVESVQALNVSVLPQNHNSLREDSGSEQEECVGVDVHTSKPLKKGQNFFDSGHVQDLMFCYSNIHYFVKSNVMASYKIIFYHVEIRLSLSSGFVTESKCTCKGSGMGRCNHVSAVLFALLDYIKKKTSPTSEMCTWNVGRKRERDPKTLTLPNDNDSSRVKKMKTKYQDFDPRPLSGRREATQSSINDFITDLQLSGSRSNLSSTMWECILPIRYDDYALDAEEQLTLKIKCDSLRDTLSVRDQLRGYATSPFCLVKQQTSSQWSLERSVRVTASTCLQVAHVVSEAAIRNLLMKMVWNSKPINSAAITYGLKHEEIDRQQYCVLKPHCVVVETGLWINPKFPELASSPDGLVIDNSALETYGLLEIKCPFVLRERDPMRFEDYLSKRLSKAFA